MSDSNAEIWLPCRPTQCSSVFGHQSPGHLTCHVLKSWWIFDLYGGRVVMGASAGRSLAYFRIFPLDRLMARVPHRYTCS